MNAFARPRLAVAGLAAALLAGCAVGPDYKRPASDTPGAFRRSASDTNAAAIGTNSFADLGWWETFEDPQLIAYIGEALTNGWDTKNAAYYAWAAGVFAERERQYRYAAAHPWGPAPRGARPFFFPPDPPPPLLPPPPDEGLVCRSGRCSDIRTTP